MALERSVRAKLIAKRDPEREREAREWIASVIGKPLLNKPIEDILRDGTVLCELINSIQPGAIKKINTSGGEFKMMENINKFQQAVKAYGLSECDIFQTVDLWEKKDIALVVTTIFALGRETYRHPEYKGPHLGPKPSEEHKRDFTAEQLKAGQCVIGLQAGSNKGATQSGQSIGASRKIILGK